MRAVISTLILPDSLQNSVDGRFPDPPAPDHLKLREPESQTLETLLIRAGKNPAALPGRNGGKENLSKGNSDLARLR